MSGVFDPAIAARYGIVECVLLSPRGPVPRRPPRRARAQPGSPAHATL
jgi:hypothetical protein